VEKIKVLLDAITAIYQQFKKDKAERREMMPSGFYSNSSVSGRGAIPWRRTMNIFIEIFFVKFGVRATV
jgi:hypothetical protein